MQLKFVMNSAGDLYQQNTLKSDLKWTEISKKFKETMSMTYSKMEQLTHILKR